MKHRARLIALGLLVVKCNGGRHLAVLNEECCSRKGQGKGGSCQRVHGLQPSWYKDAGEDSSVAREGERRGRHNAQYKECSSSEYTSRRRRGAVGAVAAYEVKMGCVCQGCTAEGSWLDPENGGNITGSRRKGLAASVARLRGGSTSTRETKETKGATKAKEDTGWGVNLNVFGWGGDNEAKRKAKQDAEDADARDALRKAREERLERELEESGAAEEAENVGDDKTAGGILVSMAKPAEPVRQVALLSDKQLWLDVVEPFFASISLAISSLYPLWHTLRGMFGLSLLFYGEDFATLAFHIVVFRISGWKKAAKSKDELVAYYKKARKTMTKAAKDVRASAAIIARKDRLVARKEEMMVEKKRLHAMGRVSAEEARAFIDKYRNDIEIIAREQEVLAETSSSILAIKGALSFKKLAASVNSLYAAVITSITASTFKRAGQLTLALTCGGLIKRTLFDLLGPVIDPIGYQIELETYVANIMRGPANLYITLAGYLSSASVFFHFFVDPQQALTITFVLLGARVVTDYIVAALNPVRWRFGMSKKLDNMPISAIIYLLLASLGFAFHGNAGLVGDYACKPFIAFLGLLNKGLNHFQATTITYFS
ncbi:unnamed protein product [Ectocarpus fasciculatus]